MWMQMVSFTHCCRRTKRANAEPENFPWIRRENPQIDQKSPRNFMGSCARSACLACLVYAKALVRFLSALGAQKSKGLSCWQGVFKIVWGNYKVLRLKCASGIGLSGLFLLALMCRSKDGRCSIWSSARLIWTMLWLARREASHVTSCSSFSRLQRIRLRVEKSAKKCFSIYLFLWFFMFFFLNFDLWIGKKSFLNLCFFNDFLWFFKW